MLCRVSIIASPFCLVIIGASSFTASSLARRLCGASSLARRLFAASSLARRLYAASSLARRLCGASSLARRLFAASSLARRRCAASTQRRRGTKMTNDDAAPIYITVRIKDILNLRLCGIHVADVHIKNGDDYKRMFKESIRLVPKVFPDFKITFSILVVPFVLFTRKLCSFAMNRISEVKLYRV